MGLGAVDIPTPPGSSALPLSWLLDITPGWLGITVAMPAGQQAVTDTLTHHL